MKKTQHQQQVQKKQHHQQAQQHQQQAAMAEREANRTKSNFLANMSHELRTPLNAIIGYSDLLMEELPDHGEDLGRIHRSGTHLLGLINQILDLAKLESGKLEFHASPVQVDQVMREVVETVMPAAIQNGNSLEVKGEGLGIAHVDEQRLRQVLINLLANAVKFTEDGSVVLTGVDKGHSVLFSVSDTGIGISPLDQQRLFQPFVQVESSSSRRFGGTGLGLSLSRQFVERMGGTLTLESALGKGSTFTVMLPRQLTAEQMAQVETALTSRVRRKDRASETATVLDDGGSP